MEMQKSMLKDVPLSANFSTSEQISDYVESKTTTSIMLSGNIIVGQNNVIKEGTVGSNILGEENIVNTNYSIAVGNKNAVGIMSYKVSDVTDVVEKSSTLSSAKVILNSTEDLPAELSAGLKVSSTDFSTSLVDFADVIASDQAAKTITIDIKKTVAVNDPIQLKGKKIFFSKDGNILNIGNQTASGNYSVAEGSENIIGGNCSHVEGYLNRTQGTYGHAEGKRTTAAWGSHSEGCATRALGNCSHAEGRASYVTTKGIQGHAEGAATLADALDTHAAGFMAHAKDERSYVWNGDTRYGKLGDPTKPFDTVPSGSSWKIPDTTLTDGDLQTQEFMDHETTVSSMYKSHGIGSFSVNPKRGEEFLYVGEKPLDKILSKYDNAFEVAKLVQSQLSTEEQYVEVEPYATRPTHRVRYADGVEENGGPDSVLREYFVNPNETYKVTTYINGSAGICFYNSADREKMISAYVNSHPSISFIDNEDITIPNSCDIIKVSTTYFSKYGNPIIKKNMFKMDLVKQEDNVASISNLKIGPIIANNGVSAENGSIAMGYEDEGSGPTNFAMATGQNSFAIGKGCQATAEYSLAQGSSSKAIGARAIAMGYKCYATSAHDFANGQSVSAVGGYSHAEGAKTTASGNASHAEGATTFAIGTQSHAEGATVSAVGSYSHAEGGSTFAGGNYSHAEGGYCKIICSADKPATASDYSHVGGHSSIVIDSQFSFAQGQNVSVDNANNAIALGFVSKALPGDHNSFVWGGGNGSYNANSNGPGTFSIYPTGIKPGVAIKDGVYICGMSLPVVLTYVFKALATDQSLSSYKAEAKQYINQILT